jgi:hypothetical protein
MDTSKSTKEDRMFTAGVSVFSGRPDPTWSVAEDIGSSLQELFETLESYEEPAISAPPLGYRGAFLRDDSNHQWLAYRGVVTLTEPNRSEARRDPGRKFERVIVDSAPQGLIPPALLAQEFD